MNFLDIQQNIRDAIAASATFAADAVIKDLGDSKDLIEASVTLNGYAVSVWPPLSGSANDNEDAHQGVEVTSIVRLEINPQKLKAIRAANDADPNQQTDGNYVNVFISAIIAAVIGAAQSPTGIRFQLAGDAFDLAAFDEGLIAYHIRFKRMAVFGS